MFLFKFSICLDITLSRYCYVSNIIPPFLYHSGHVFRQVAGEVHLSPCHGMDEAQGTGMEQLTGTKPEAVLDERFIG
jgi:hypothetical protein